LILLGGPRALIVTHTHELASQIHRVIELLSASSSSTLSVCLLTTSRSAKPTKWKNNGIWDIVVATPMRLLKLLKRENSPLYLDTVEMLILDEADRLFESDFVEQADGVFAACTNPNLQRAMFSATIGDRAERLARAIMFNPVRVIVGARVTTPPHSVLQQELVYAGTEQGKMVHFRSLLLHGLQPPVLVFTQDKQRATDLYKVLISERINVDVLTQDRSEHQRKEAINNFRVGTVWILISTDLLGRGIDFKGVNVVINWDMPKSIPDYVHRVGRTGRAGRVGRAITYFEDVDLAMAKAVAQIIRGAGGDPPHWLLQSSATKNKKPKNTGAVPRQRIVDGATKPNKRPKKRVVNK
jgi:ATP-dependent RNA helicase DDX52/ROK1